MTQFVPPQTWTRHAVLPGIRTRSPNRNISECLGVNLRTVQRIQKELGESNADNEGTAARKTHSAPEFVGDIKIMIDNEPSVNEDYSQGHGSVSSFL